MTFTPRDLKDVSSLVAKKLEHYMNQERREERFDTQGHYRTHPKMKTLDLMYQMLETTELSKKSSRRRHRSSSSKRKESKKTAVDEEACSESEEAESQKKSGKERSSKRKEKKKNITPVVINNSRCVVPPNEAERLTDIANKVFEEQDLDKLHVIHRYRPHSKDVAPITENGKVANYTLHVGSALHSKNYVDYYLKEGLQSSKREYAKRLQRLQSKKEGSNPQAQQEGESCDEKKRQPHYTPKKCRCHSMSSSAEHRAGKLLIRSLGNNDEGQRIYNPLVDQSMESLLSSSLNYGTLTPIDKNKPVYDTVFKNNCPSSRASSEKLSKASSQLNKARMFANGYGYRIVADNQNCYGVEDPLKRTESRAEIASSEEYCKFSSVMNNSVGSGREGDGCEVIDKGIVQPLGNGLDYNKFQIAESSMILSGLEEDDSRAKSYNNSRPSSQRSVRSQKSYRSVNSCSIYMEGSMTTCTEESDLYETSKSDADPDTARSISYPLSTPRRSKKVYNMRPIQTLITASDAAPDVPRLGIDSDMNDSNGMNSSLTSCNPEEYITAEEKAKMNRDARALDDKKNSSQERAGEDTLANNADMRADRSLQQVWYNEHHDLDKEIVRQNSACDPVTNEITNADDEDNFPAFEGYGEMEPHNLPSIPNGDEHSESTNPQTQNAVECDVPKDIDMNDGKEESLKSEAIRSVKKANSIDFNMGGSLNSSRSIKSNRRRAKEMEGKESERGEDKLESMELHRGQVPDVEKNILVKFRPERGDDTPRTMAAKGRLTKSAKKRGMSNYYTMGNEERGLEKEHFEPLGRDIPETYIKSKVIDEEDEIETPASSRPTSASSMSSTSSKDSGHKEKCDLEDELDHENKVKSQPPSQIEKSIDGRGDDSASIKSGSNLSATSLRHKRKGSRHSDNDKIAAIRASQEQYDEKDNPVESKSVDLSGGSRGSRSIHVKLGIGEGYCVEGETLARGYDEGILRPSKEMKNKKVDDISEHALPIEKSRPSSKTSQISAKPEMKEPSVTEAQKTSDKDALNHSCDTRTDAKLSESLKHLTSANDENVERHSMNYTVNEVKSIITNEEVKSITNEEVKPVLENEEVKSIITNEEVKSIITNEEVKPVLENEEVKSITTNEEVKPVLTNEEVKSIITNEEVKSVHKDISPDSTIKNVVAEECCVNHSLHEKICDNNAENFIENENISGKSKDNELTHENKDNLSENTVFNKDDQVIESATKEAGQASFVCNGEDPKKTDDSPMSLSRTEKAGFGIDKNLAEISKEKDHMISPEEATTGQEIPLEEKAFIECDLSDNDVIKGAVSGSASMFIEDNDTVIDFRPSSASTAIYVDKEIYSDHKRLSLQQQAQIVEVTEIESMAGSARESHRSALNREQTVPHPAVKKKKRSEGQVPAVLNIADVKLEHVSNGQDIVHPAMKRYSLKETSFERDTPKVDNLRNTSLPCLINSEANIEVKEMDLYKKEKKEQTPNQNQLENIDEGNISKPDGKMMNDGKEQKEKVSEEQREKGKMEKNEKMNKKVTDCKPDGKMMELNKEEINSSKEFANKAKELDDEQNQNKADMKYDTEIATKDGAREAMEPATIKQGQGEKLEKEILKEKEEKHVKRESRDSKEERQPQEQMGMDQKKCKIETVQKHKVDELDAAKQKSASEIKLEQDIPVSDIVCSNDVERNVAASAQTGVIDKLRDMEIASIEPHVTSKGDINETETEEIKQTAKSIQPEINTDEKELHEKSQRHRSTNIESESVENDSPLQQPKGLDEENPAETQFKQIELESQKQIENKAKDSVESALNEKCDLKEEIVTGNQPVFEEWDIETKGVKSNENNQDVMISELSVQGIEHGNNQNSKVILFEDTTKENVPQSKNFVEPEKEVTPTMNGLLLEVEEGKIPQANVFVTQSGGETPPVNSLGGALEKEKPLQMKDAAVEREEVTTAPEVDQTVENAREQAQQLKDPVIETKDEKTPQMKGPEVEGQKENMSQVENQICETKKEKTLPAESQVIEAEKERIPPIENIENEKIQHQVENWEIKTEKEKMPPVENLVNEIKKEKIPLVENQVIETEKEKTSPVENQVIETEKEKTSPVENQVIETEKEKTSPVENQVIETEKEKTSPVENQVIETEKEKTSPVENQVIETEKEKTSPVENQVIETEKEKTPPVENQGIETEKEKTPPVENQVIETEKEKTSPVENQGIETEKEKTSPAENQVIETEKEKTPPVENQVIETEKEKTPPIQNQMIETEKEKTSPVENQVIETEKEKTSPVENQVIETEKEKTSPVENQVIETEKEKTSPVENQVIETEKEKIQQVDNQAVEENMPQEELQEFLEKEKKMPAVTEIKDTLQELEDSVVEREKKEIPLAGDQRIEVEKEQQPQLIDPVSKIEEEKSLPRKDTVDETDGEKTLQVETQVVEIEKGNTPQVREEKTHTENPAVEIAKEKSYPIEDPVAGGKERNAPQINSSLEETKKEKTS